MSFVTGSFLHSIAAARPSSPECVGLDADPDDDGGDEFAFEADSNKVHARPLHAHGIEDVVDLKSKLVLQDLPEGVGPKLLGRKVRLGTSGQLPSIGARVSHEDALGGQPVIIVLGFDIGKREAK
jgi:hypothetical protein